MIHMKRNLNLLMIVVFVIWFHPTFPNVFSFKINEKKKKLIM